MPPIHISGVVESLKIITREKSQRIAKYAFDYATRHDRKRVTAIHKANIMYNFFFLHLCILYSFQWSTLRKLSDGLFLRECENVSKLYPNIEFRSMIIDNCCMQVH